MIPSATREESVAQLMGWIERLCSPEFGGRRVGSPGERLARDFLTGTLAGLGFGPIAGHAEPFTTTVAQVPRRPRLTVDGLELEYLIDFGVNVQGATSGGTVAGTAIWYGSELPDDRARGRVAVCRPSVVPDPDAALEAYLLRHRRARDVGALALLQIAAECRRGKLMMHRREAPGLPSLDVSPHVVPLAFSSSSPTPGHLGSRIEVDVALEDLTVTSGGNVVMASGVGSARLVLVAHYDHVGTATDGKFFPGAADNASGVAVVLAAAWTLVSQGLGPLVVLLTTGEEAGMVGARHYVEHHTEQLETARLVVNVDEVGGCRKQPLLVLGQVPEGPPEVLVEWPVARGPLPRSFSDDRVLAPRVPFLVAVTSASSPGVVHTVRDTPRRLFVPKLVAARDLVVQLGRRAFSGPLS